MMMWWTDAQSGDGEQAVKNAINIAQVVGGIAVGALLGLVVAVVLAAVLRAALRKTRLLASLLKRVRGPVYWALMIMGALVGWNVAFADTDLSTLSPWVSATEHGLEILVILGLTWVLFAAMWVFEDAAQLRSAADDGRSSRFETQAQVLRRLLQAVVALIGVGLVLSTFPSAQRVMTAMFASAGIASVVAGLAAQSTLGNVFAGVQLAFTDAIRVGDTVVVETQMGVIEEITLTYVVVRLWDERRLIMPSTLFTTKSFENWTRRAAKQIGTVEMKVDWAAPVERIRNKVQALLLSTDLWDGRSWSVQVTDADSTSMTVRIAVSASNSGALWDLRCYLRENMLEWLAKEQSWTRPLTRVQPTETVTVKHDDADEQVARLASELAGIAAGDTAGGDGSQPGTSDASAAPITTEDAVHAARLKAARRKSKQARRRSLRRMSQALAGQQGVGEDSRAGSAAQATRVFTTAEIQAITQGKPMPEQPLDSAATQVFNAGVTPGVADTKTVAGTQAVGTHASGTQATGTQVGAGTQPAISMQATPGTQPSTGASSGETTSGGAGERFWSGTPEAEERAKIFDGPGDDVIAEREARAQQIQAEKEAKASKSQSQTKTQKTKEQP